jgi:hypothetical protein
MQSTTLLAKVAVTGLEAALSAFFTGVPFAAETTEVKPMKYIGSPKHKAVLANLASCRKSIIYLARLAKLATDEDSLDSIESMRQDVIYQVSELRDELSHSKTVAALTLSR